MTGTDHATGLLWRLLEGFTELPWFDPFSPFSDPGFSTGSDTLLKFAEWTAGGAQN